MRDMLDARKRGDLAFRDKDFKNAIDCYSQVYSRLYTLRLLVELSMPLCAILLC